MYSVVGGDGAVYGPVDVPTIRAWIAQGRVTPATNLIEPLTGRVLRADQSQDLVGAFGAQVPPVQSGPSASFNATFNPGPSFHPGIAPYPNAAYGAYVPSPRNKIVAIVLAFFLGGIGIHRFYLGYSGRGLFMLLFVVFTCGYGGFVTGVMALIDLVRIATDSLPDAEGRTLV